MRVADIKWAKQRTFVATGLDGVALLSGRRITEIHAAVGRKLVALGVDRVAPLSGRRITEIHAAVGRKLVALGCHGATPLLHPWRRVMPMETPAMTPSTPHPLENLSVDVSIRHTPRRCFGIPN